MLTIVKHGLDPATRVAVSRLLDATRATKLGTAYDLDGAIPPRLATAVTRVEQLQQQPEKPGLRNSDLKVMRTQGLVHGFNLGREDFIEDIAFMLNFFQSNAPRLAITPGQKERFKSILERVKRSRA